MTNRRIALVGAGGHAVSILNAVGHDGILGYVAPEPSDALGLKWLATDEEFLESERWNDVPVNISIVAGRSGNMALRRRIVELYGNHARATIVAPTAIITAGTVLGDGCSVMSGVIVNGATLGRDCIVNTGAVVEHACVISDNVFIGPNATVCGCVRIGSDCFIGAGATVLNGIEICSGTVIGGGAVVASDITEPGVYAGVPAKILHK